MSIHQCPFLQALADAVLAACDPDLADGLRVDDDRGVGGALHDGLPLEALQHRAAPLLHLPHHYLLLRIQHSGKEKTASAAAAFCPPQVLVRLC